VWNHAVSGYDADQPFVMSRNAPDGPLVTTSKGAKRMLIHRVARLGHRREASEGEAGGRELRAWSENPLRTIEDRRG